MKKYQKKVVKKVDNSLFLDEDKKSDIKKIMKTATKEELADLSTVLDSEMDEIFDLLTAYLEKGGEVAFENVKHILKKSSGFVRKAEEEEERDIEKQKMEELFNKL
jgi:hypothetical protein